MSVDIQDLQRKLNEYTELCENAIGQVTVLRS
jgi:hypothetical protein